MRQEQSAYHVSCIMLMSTSVFIDNNVILLCYVFGTVPIASFTVDWLPQNKPGLEGT